MSIVAADLKVRLSVTTGAAGNSTAQGNVNNSLGKYISTTDVTDAALNNLFDDISGDENAASTVDYRGVFVYNSHGSLNWLTPVMWLSAETAGGANAAVGWDTTAPSAVGAAPAQGLTIANETTAPAGVSFSSPTTKASGLALSGATDLNFGNVKQYWVRRTATNSVALANDSVTVRVEGDTA